MVVHLVGLCVLAVWWVISNPFERVNRQTERAALAALTVGGISLLIVHIASLGEFMHYDVPDEPWLVSMATNYADHGDLSPSYIASTFGTPDPILPRYYWAMGLWLRLTGDATPAQLRTFPLLVGGLAILILGLGLWRTASLTSLQKITGVVVLMALIPFVRTSHNLRMDIGLAVYGVLILVGLLKFFEADYRQKRWMLLMGAAFYIGLETVPTAAIPLACAAGLTLLLWFFRQPDRRQNWQYVGVYVAACALSILLYVIVHFSSNPQTSLDSFRQFSSLYFTQSRSLGPRLPFDNLVNVQLRYGLSLSPVELITLVLATMVVWRSGRSNDRWVLAPFGISLILLFGFFQFSYSYWVLFAPALAYIAARALRSKTAILIGTFVLAPALLSPPIHDMIYATQQQFNQHEIDTTAALADQIPADATILGEPIFWFSLHSTHNYIGWTGAGFYSKLHNLTLQESLEVINPDVVTCWQGTSERCTLVSDTGLYEPPKEFIVGENRYWIFLHR
jgi:hypothetical protein